jgi:hypothetical protein
MRNHIAYYHAFGYDPRTVSYDRWRGVATLKAIGEAGLKADLSYPLYADESLANDGWTFRAPPSD